MPRANFLRLLMILLTALFIQDQIALSASDQHDPMAISAQSAHFAVGISRCTFVDQTRGVLDYETTRPTTLSNVRTLVTEIRYPTSSQHRGVIESSNAVPAVQQDGFPMIIFAHGYDVTPDTYARMLDAWVRAGFVVAAPIFPDENEVEVAAQHDANTEDDLVNEPADLAFVTRQILDASSARDPRCPIVHRLIRASEIGLAGHSDGATVVAMLSYAHGRDPQGTTYQALRAGLHYRATIVMSGQEDGVDAYGPLAPDPTLLVIQSATDQCNSPRNALKLYGDIHQANKSFLELQSAHHLPPFDGVDIPAFGVVVRTTVRFFKITFRGATPGASFAAYANADPSIARMFVGGNGPAIPDVLNETVNCGPS